MCGGWPGRWAWRVGNWHVWEVGNQVGMGGGYASMCAREGMRNVHGENLCMLTTQNRIVWVCMCACLTKDMHPCVSGHEEDVRWVGVRVGMNASVHEGGRTCRWVVVQQCMACIRKMCGGWASGWGECVHACMHEEEGKQACGRACRRAWRCACMRGHVGHVHEDSQKTGYLSSEPAHHCCTCSHLSRRGLHG